MVSSDDNPFLKRQQHQLNVQDFVEHNQRKLREGYNPPVEPEPEQVKSPLENSLHEQEQHASSPSSESQEKFVLVNNHSHQLIGLDKCVRCGSSSLSYSIERKALVCADCRNEDTGVNVADRFGDANNIVNLRSRTISSGAQRILTDEVQVTIECQGCGAEVTVDTDNSLSARCHWCRQQLSINNQIPNGAVPDGILPFRVPKTLAMKYVKNFVKRRRFFANSSFKREFKSDNVFGVYLPYVIADAKFIGGLEGVGQKHLRSYSKSSGNSRRTYYDYEEYALTRELAVLANDMSLEASSKRRIETASNTNNVINAVLPFPIEDAVEFRAHYLQGFNSERRDLDIEELDHDFMRSMLTIIRAKGDDSAERYRKRGVRWEKEWAKLLGAHQATVYLPLWLYSYVEPHAKNPRTGQRGPLIHYIAVNGITGQTMGSIPINWRKLHGYSWLIGSVTGGVSFYLYLLLNGFPLYW